MSISNFQEKFLAKGCGTAILIGCAVVFGALAFSYFGKGGGVATDEDGAPAKVVANVAGSPVAASTIELALRQIQSQQEQQADPTTTPPQALAAQYGEAMTAVVEQAAVESIAKADGVNPTDDQLRQSMKDQLAKQVETMKLQMMMRGQLKPGASDADVDAIVKTQTGSSLSELERKTLTELEDALKDPKRRSMLVANMTRPILVTALASKSPASVAEVKSSYDEDTFKRVLLKEKPSPTPSSKDRIKQVQAFLTGGASFEAAMDRYSDEPAAAKKKVSENTMVFSRGQMARDKSLTSLLSLKVGAVSGPVQTPDGTAIYKLISVKNQAPPDFDKNPSKYQKEYQESRVQTDLADQIKALIATKTEWSSKGYQALYDATRTDFNATKAPAVYSEAKTAISKTEGYDLREAQLAEYTAFDLIWNAPTADKVKLRPERIQVLNDFLQSQENFDVRMELVGLYEADKDGANAANCLAAAARSNNNYDQIGQSHFGDVEARIITLKSAGLLSSAQVQQIQDVQAQWKKDKADADAERARQKAEEEAAQKKAAEEAKKAAKDKPTVKVKDSTSSTDFLSKPSGAPSGPNLDLGPKPPSGAPKH